MAGLAGLASAIDPMGATLTPRSRLVPCRRVTEDTARALRIAPGETLLVIEFLWLLGGEPGAPSATYFPERLASTAGDITGLLSGSPGLAGGPLAAGLRKEGAAGGWPQGAGEDTGWEDTGWEDTGGWPEAAWLSRGNAEAGQVRGHAGTGTGTQGSLAPEGRAPPGPRSPGSSAATPVAGQQG
jgi:hypothetical protein